MYCFKNFNMRYQDLEKCIGLIGYLFGHDFTDYPDPEKLIFCKRCGWVIHTPTGHQEKEESREVIRRNEKSEYEKARDNYEGTAYPYHEHQLKTYNR